MKHYFRTTDIDLNQLKEQVSKNKGQNRRVYQLFKIFGRLTSWDILMFYENIFGITIPKTSVNRVMTDLKDIGAIKIIGGDDGEFGKPVNLCEIVDGYNGEIYTPKRSKKRLPKFLHVDIVFNEDGGIDTEKMIDELLNKLGITDTSHYI